LSKKDLKLKIDELSTTLGTIKGLEIEIGRIYDDDWENHWARQSSGVGCGFFCFLLALVWC